MNTEHNETAVAYAPDLLYVGGRFERGRALACDAEGRVVGVTGADAQHGGRVVRLANRALLPGMVNAHSHAFQRVIRGRTEFRTSARDSFWTWREAMYAAAARLTPEDLYDASRMAFLEMALAGITTVGEFHYLHRAPDGSEYDDPNLLAKQVVRAARDVGLRIALLRVFYARSGFNTPPDERQRRFIEPDPETFITNTETLLRDLGDGEDAADDGATRGAWAGVAPHSVRAVPLEHLVRVSNFADARRLPVHMHVAEQPAEVAACREENAGLSPLTLLGSRGLLNERFTAVHGVYFEPAEIRSYLRGSGATVCACPTTERNLGDGVVPADLFFNEGVNVSLGTDSHAQIDLLEDARELEYHLRLTRVERNVLAPAADAETAPLSSLAARLFGCATTNGARSVGGAGGALEAGRPADFFTVALDDPSVAGAGEEDLLASIVFSLARTAVREVAVSGRLVVEEGRHRAQHEVVTRFAALQKRLWR